MAVSVTAENKQVFGMTGETHRKDETMNELDTTIDTLDEEPTSRTGCDEARPEATGQDSGEELRPTEHKQVHIKAYGQEAEVDVGIAPLILELWRCGIFTIMTCQDGAHGYVRVSFPNSTEAADFMNIVAEFDPEPESLYQRMLSVWDVPNNWIFKTFPFDCNLFEEDPTADEVNEYHKGPPDFGFSTSVWFPPSDLSAVMAKLAAHPSYDWADDDPMDGAVPLSKDD
jgi:hypothetical protein